MSKSVNAIFIKDHYEVKDKHSGLFYKPNTSTLYIRIIQNGIAKKISLQIQLKNTDIQTYFDTNKQRFKDRKKFPQGIEYNEKIEDELKKVGAYKEFSNIPDRRKSFIRYWESLITTTTVHGTRIKHETVLERLKKYLKTLKKTDLLFIEIDSQFLRGLHFHLKEIPDPRKLSTNTANHYLKIIHSVINTAKNSNYFVYSLDPFIGFTFSKTEDPIKDEKVLSQTELGIFINHDAVRDDLFPIQKLNEELNKYRLAFLFQLFANGMRVSDMLLLRWNNLEGSQLNYKMFKTKRAMTIPINTNLIKILCNVHPQKDYMLKIFNRYYGGDTKATIIVDNEPKELNLTTIEKKLEEISIRKDEKSHKQKQATYQGHVEVDGYLVEPKNVPLYYSLLNGRMYLISQIESKMNIQLDIRTTKIKNDFVFPLLDNEAFKDVNEKNDFSKISLPQYKMIKTATIIYNRKLKDIAKQFGFKVSLSTHSARHSFASYLLSMGNVNTYDIQRLLGHKNIHITSAYLEKHFSTDKLNDTNRRLSRENTIG